MTLKWHGKEIAEAIAYGVVDAMLTCAADLQHRSVNRAPINTGKLRESCVVDNSGLNAMQFNMDTTNHSITISTSTEFEVKIGYSPEVDDYSVVQHERLDFNHPRGGEAKYLENPFNENAQQYIGNISEAVKGALR